MFSENEQSLYNRKVDSLPISIRKHIPLCTKSLERYTSLLRYYEARHIDAQLQVQACYMSYIGKDFKYSTRLVSVASNERKIYYDENFGYRPSYSNDNLEEFDKRYWLLRSYLTVNNRLHYIQSKIPYISFDLFPGEDGNGLTDDYCQKLDAKIAKYGISPFKRNPGNNQS